MIAIPEGARLFDEGRFFEAHEAWESHWLAEKDESKRTVLQGLIQIAAAFHKLFAMNAPDSAQSLLAKGLAKLDACSDEVEQNGLASFRQGIRKCAQDLAAGRFDRGAIPRLTAI